MQVGMVFHLKRLQYTSINQSKNESNQMKRLLFLCAVLFSITAVHATDPDPETDKIGTISGKVLDATLREPLPYVNIIIKNI